MQEVWKDIPGYEGRYQVSSLGRVKSLARRVRHLSRTGTESSRVVRERILKPGRLKSGHYSLPLGKGDHGHPVHQLVMQAFVGPCPSGLEVLHINGDPADNRLGNLHYGSRAENVHDMYALGHGKSRILPRDIPSIKARLKHGETAPMIARTYGVAPSSIYLIKEGRSFRWLNEGFSST